MGSEMCIRDSYEKVSGSYAIRTGAMIPTTVLFFTVMAAFQARMLASDGRLFDLKSNWKGLTFLFGRKGLFTKLTPQYLDFFKRDFHPSQHDTDALLEEWREKLFGPNGLLTEQHAQATQRKGKGKKTH